MTEYSLGWGLYPTLIFFIFSFCVKSSSNDSTSLNTNLKVEGQNFMKISITGYHNSVLIIQEQVMSSECEEQTALHSKRPG